MASSWHLLLPVLVLLAAAGPAASWWDAGHMLVAEVAKQYLQQTGDLSPLMKVGGGWTKRMAGVQTDAPFFLGAPHPEG